MVKEKAKAETKKTCPMCNKIYVGYPALSRKDNKTLICPQCGVQEALEDYLKHLKIICEDAINFLKGYLDEEVYTEKCRNAHEIAIKVLEQEPVLDKIRAEIADIYCSQYCENPYTAATVKKNGIGNY